MTIPINYKQQPTGNTCGPACIYMVLRYILNSPNDLPFDVEIADTIEGIAEACGTDWIVGTPPERMKKGLDACKIKYIEYIHSPRPFNLIKDTIDSGNIPIVRTITKGMPHWIIVNGYTDEYFNILDPWMGVIKYTPKELNDIWMPRDYMFFEIKTKITDYDN
jgi:ABC-type bacteriocin/lantibiotic exporter with double-glycine peptidase domain